MKISRLSLTFSLVASICGVAIQIAQAGPVGPSAKMAAQLKKYPTSKWLAHYLPDDRYKIAGGVWKYVSTDLDTYYHRPDSPLMLRQSPGRVIGFASAAEAEEAGYKPAPGTISSMPSAVGGSSPYSIQGAGSRILLTDGVSSMVLPRGWSKMPGSSQNISGLTLAMDMMKGPSGQNLSVMSITFPASMRIDMGQGLTVRNMKSMLNTMGTFGTMVPGTTAQSNSASARMIRQMAKTTKISSARINGMEGVLTVMPNPTGKGAPMKQYTFGRGQKMWTIMEMSQGGGAAAVIKTVRLK